jgi:hypothetical protein
MKILERQGFSDFRFPAYDPDFRSFPGKFDRKLPENLLRRSLPDSTEVMFLMRSSLGRASGEFFPSTRTFARELPETIVHFTLGLSAVSAIGTVNLLPNALKIDLIGFVSILIAVMSDRISSLESRATCQFEARWWLSE